MTEADLPFDVNAEVIEIPPEAYGIWYIDAMDKPDRYRGKTVEFTGMVLENPGFPEEQLCSWTYGDDLLRGRYDVLRFHVQGKKCPSA